MTKTVVGSRVQNGVASMFIEEPEKKLTVWLQCFYVMQNYAPLTTVRWGQGIPVSHDEPCEWAIQNDVLRGLHTPWQ